MSMNYKYNELELDGMPLGQGVCEVREGLCGVHRGWEVRVRGWGEGGSDSGSVSTVSN